MENQQVVEKLGNHNLNKKQANYWDDEVTRECTCSHGKEGKEFEQTKSTAKITI